MFVTQGCRGDNPGLTLANAFGVFSRIDNFSRNGQKIAVLASPLPDLTMLVSLSEGSDLWIKVSRRHLPEATMNKLDVILLALERLQQDLYLAKCEIKTAVREISLQQNSIYDLYMKFRGDLLEINERLHGMELHQQRQNSST